MANTTDSDRAIQPIGMPGTIYVTSEYIPLLNKRKHFPVFTISLFTDITAKQEIDEEFVNNLEQQLIDGFEDLGDDILILSHCWRRKKDDTFYKLEIVMQSQTLIPLCHFGAMLPNVNLTWSSPKPVPEKTAK